MTWRWPTSTPHHFKGVVRPLPLRLLLNFQRNVHNSILTFSTGGCTADTSEFVIHEGRQHIVAGLGSMQSHGDDGSLVRWIVRLWNEIMTSSIVRLPLLAVSNYTKTYHGEQLNQIGPGISWMASPLIEYIDCGPPALFMVFWLLVAATLAAVEIIVFSSPETGIQWNLILPAIQQPADRGLHNDDDERMQ